ncbi:NADP-dependent oxidoreductase [Zhouia sp. PK063]|uniref:NADP-dependent oxidoreductase n=1 Tax=Zhouia sp. PK063 TaxID=3373602 RepID=UPI0037A37990
MMKAVRIHEFGGTEVLKIRETAIPTPAPDEILVNVYASGVNPVDWVVREGGNDVLRSFLKLPMTIGWDAAGIVTEVGSEVTHLKKGDAVYGVPNFPGDGSYAEYVAAKASQFALKPKSSSFIEAAGVPLTGLVACNALFELGKLQKHQRVFIHGASGGVGSLAVQLAKAKGAYVIGSASTGNQAFLKELGADETIDYKTQQFEKIINNVDLFFDASPLRDEQERLKGISTLKNGGIFVSVNVDFPLSDTVQEALDKKNATGALLALQTNHEHWLTEMATLIEEGKLKVMVEHVYPLEQVAEAHLKSATWHVRGKLILEIKKENKAV